LSEQGGPQGGANNDTASEQRPREQPRRTNWPLHIGLFLLTCATTTWAGVLQVQHEISPFRLDLLLPHFADGLSYSVSIMAILLAHEMGHYLLARWHGVAASLPYFLPVPLPMVGTMGAVIVMKGRITSRNALVDWAAAGPLAGMVVALPVLAYGIHLSPLGPFPMAEGQVGMLEGNSVLYLLVKLAVKGAILPSGGVDVQLHLVAWAGWLGFLVTMINLLPIGQLDGGHIAFAYFGDRYDTVSRWLHRGLPVLGVGVSAYVVLDLLRKVGPDQAVGLGWGAGFPWLIWWGLLQVFRRMSRGRYHPPVGEEPLTRGRRRLCLLMIVVFGLIFIPIPLRATL
jgi:membrane-associated protease RseP (regulator of RpoE activity)